MSVSLHEADGTDSAGDPKISQIMRNEADRIGGYIVDNETGDIIYDARKVQADV